MYTNVDIVELLESEGTLDYLLLDYDGAGIDPDDLEDDELADLFVETRDLLEKIKERLAPAMAEYYGDENELGD